MQNILHKYSYTFYAYGSQVKGTARKFSDLEICYQEEIPLNTFAHLEADLKESYLLIMVELID